MISSATDVFAICCESKLDLEVVIDQVGLTWPERPERGNRGLDDKRQEKNADHLNHTAEGLALSPFLIHSSTIS